MCLLRKTFFFLSLLFSCSYSKGQLCDKKNIFFEFDVKVSKETELEKLNLIRNLLISSEYYLELHGHTDLKGTEAYNFRLAQERISWIRNYLTKDATFPLHVIEKNYGKTNPVMNDTSEQAGRLNRRVEISYFPVKNNRIVITGRQGTTMEIPWDVFAPCGICASNPRMTEILSEEQAKTANIPLISENGQELITGGMMKFEFEPCNGKPISDCIELKVEIPGNNVSNDMTVWESKEVNGQITWVDTKRPIQYTETIRKCGLNINLCKIQTMTNCDKPKPHYGQDLTVPAFLRKDSIHLMGNLFEKINDTLFVRSNELPEENLNFEPGIFYDIGIKRNEHAIYEIKDSIARYLTNKGNTYLHYVFPLSAYTRTSFDSDTSVLIKLSRKTAQNILIRMVEFDTSFAAKKYKNSSSKFIFSKPTREFALQVEKKDQSVQEFLSSSFKKRYKKRRHFYKVKIKN